MLCDTITDYCVIINELMNIIYCHGNADTPKQNKSVFLETNNIHWYKGESNGLIIVNRHDMKQNHTTYNVATIFVFTNAFLIYSIDLLQYNGF